MIPTPTLWIPRLSDAMEWSVAFFAPRSDGKGGTVQHHAADLRIHIDPGEGSRRGSAQLSAWTPSCYGVTAGSPAWTAPEVAVECSRSTPRDELIRRVVAALAMVWDETAALRAVAAQREEWRREVANG
jgi:hypothetical protein